MQFPVILKSVKFWEGVSYILAGVDALLILFGVLPPEYTYTAAAILSGVLSVLRFFNVTPELRARGLM